MSHTSILALELLFKIIIVFIILWLAKITIIIILFVNLRAIVAIYIGKWTSSCCAWVTSQFICTHCCWYVIVHLLILISLATYHQLILCLKPDRVGSSHDLLNLQFKCSAFEFLLILVQQILENIRVSWDCEFHN